MPVNANRERALTKLLEELFDPDEILRIVRELDGGLCNELVGRDLGLSALTDELVRKSVQRGLIAGEFFAILQRERPKLSQRISDIARVWGVELKVSTPSATPIVEPDAVPTSSVRRAQIDIFISHSHKDEEWKNRLVGQLDVLAHKTAISVWDDTRIAAGDEWRPAIEQAVKEARTAILLVSADFLTSKFVRSVELSKLLQRRQAEGVCILPVITRPCYWEAIDWLSKLQCRPKNAKPLSLCASDEADMHLVNLVQEVHELLTTTIDEKVSNSAKQVDSAHRVGRSARPSQHVTSGTPQAIPSMLMTASTSSTQVLIDQTMVCEASRLIAGAPTEPGPYLGYLAQTP